MVIKFYEQFVLRREKENELVKRNRTELITFINSILSVRTAVGGIRNNQCFAYGMGLVTQEYKIIVHWTHNFRPVACVPPIFL